MTPTVQILIGDALSKLKELPDESVQCCVTSPPYLGLRSYLKNDHPDKGLELGKEKTPEEYISKMTAVFSEVKRVLKSDGVIWVNVGDTYNFGKSRSEKSLRGGHDKLFAESDRLSRKRSETLKPKDLVGIPWMLAFALRTDGWYLRSDIIWEKPNPMPESVTDRPTKGHEYIFLLSKSEKYFYDADAIAEPASYAMYAQMEEGYEGEATKDYQTNGVQNPSDVKSRIIANARKKSWKGSEFHTGKTGEHQLGRSSKKRGEFNGKTNELEGREAFRAFTITRNKRTVWRVPTNPFKGAHFATFPPDLIKPCILAGSRPGDTVLDPFLGSGTTAEVSLALGRNCIGIDLNPDYLSLIEQRTQQPGFILK